MRINITSVMVDDQSKAREFYTEKLGFRIKHDVEVGEGAFWLTLVSPENPDGTELLLEPLGHPAAKTFQQALHGDGIPLTQFAVDDVQAEFDRLSGLGVRFTMEPTTIEGSTLAVFDDTCGNLIQIIEQKA